VVCDLSAVPEGAEPDAVEVFATTGRPVRDWPGTSVAVVCLDPRMARRWPLIPLAAHPLGRHLILANSMDAGTDIDLSLACDQGALRLTGRNSSPDLPHQPHTDLDPHARNSPSSQSCPVYSGVLPTADGGKVVWAVLNATRADTGPIGGAEGTRTPDPLVANEVRYQLRHSPMVRTKR
jgi:hypothetical protein